MSAQKWIIAMCCLFSTALTAQKNGWALETVVHAGTVIRHSPKITIGSGQLVPGVELGLFKQTTGAQAWERHFHKPQYGAALVWMYPGPQAHGSAIGLLPSIAIPFRSNAERGWVFRFGLGAGIVTDPYHFSDNPTHNAIGSRINNITQIRFAWRARSAKYQWQAGGAFTHFSNGGIAQPNFGVNMPSAFVSIRRNRQVERTADLAKSAKMDDETPQPKRQRRFGVAAQAQYTQIEYLLVYDGPKYPVYGVGAAVYYHNNPFHRWFLGADFERNQAVYAWYIRATGGADAEKVRRGSDRTGVFVGNEWLFGRVGLYLQGGMYVGNQRNKWVFSNNYNKIAWRYYLPMGAFPVRSHVNLQMKAHKSAAEYIAIGVGVEW
jgi:Lipid A 3-O-deacylase (PagL)